MLVLLRSLVTSIAASPPAAASGEDKALQTRRQLATVDATGPVTAKSKHCAALDSTRSAPVGAVECDSKCNREAHRGCSPPHKSPSDPMEGKVGPGGNIAGADKGHVVVKFAHPASTWSPPAVATGTAPAESVAVAVAAGRMDATPAMQVPAVEPIGSLNGSGSGENGRILARHETAGESASPGAGGDRATLHTHGPGDVLAGAGGEVARVAVALQRGPLPGGVPGWPRHGPVKPAQQHARAQPCQSAPSKPPTPPVALGPGPVLPLLQPPPALTSLAQRYGMAPEKKAETGDAAASSTLPMIRCRVDWPGESAAQRTPSRIAVSPAVVHHRGIQAETLLGSDSDDSLSEEADRPPAPSGSIWPLGDSSVLEAQPGLPPGFPGRGARAVAGREWSDQTGAGGVLGSDSTASEQRRPLRRCGLDRATAGVWGWSDCCSVRTTPYLRASSNWLHHLRRG